MGKNFFMPIFATLTIDCVYEKFHSRSMGGITPTIPNFLIEWILMRRRSGMAESVPDARHVMCALIGALLTIMALVSPLYATGLKDIRIGEYTEYTRVVFEFDQPIGQEDHIVQYNNRLTAMFPETDPDLVRKIPFKRSRRIKNLQVWVGKNDLSVVLFFNFANFRYESFRMRDPFRIAVDIYPLKGQAPGGTPSTPEPKREPLSNGQPPTRVKEQ